MSLSLAMIAMLCARIHAAGIHFVPIKATSLLYCPQDHRIYATAPPDSKGGLGNTVCRIDPDSGKVEASVVVGDDPKGIVRSADGKTLWVMVAGNKMVRPIDRATMKAGLNFPVGDNQAARRLCPIPEMPNGLIVHRFNPSISPPGDNLCVFINGRQAMDGAPCDGALAYGIDASRVITMSEGSSSNFYLGVNAMLNTEHGSGFFDGVRRSFRKPLANPLFGDLAG
jgi:DNA-binding beta-propeller fold protein YncE